MIKKYRAGKYTLDEIGIPGGIGKSLDDYDNDDAQVRGWIRRWVLDVIVRALLQHAGVQGRWINDRLINDRYAHRNEQDRLDQISLPEGYVLVQFWENEAAKEQFFGNRGKGDARQCAQEVQWGGIHQPCQCPLGCKIFI